MQLTAQKRDLLSISDLTSQDVCDILDLAVSMKQGQAYRSLAGQSIALLFEKPSLRTRVSFEVAMHQLGGHALTLTKQEVGLGEREPVADVARTLSRYVHAIVIRNAVHATQKEMARYASVPVINALSDYEHPCQALADILTIYEKKGDLTGVTVAFVGDGNNVSGSLALACAKMGAAFRIASPAGYALKQGVLAEVQAAAAASGGSITLLQDPRTAVADADVVYTDVWVSMGFEHEREQRLKAFQSYQVTPSLLDLARPDCIFMHDLPARPGQEISPGLLEDPRAVVFDQAENRLHAQKAVLALLLGARETDFSSP